MNCRSSLRRNEKPTRNPQSTITEIEFAKLSLWNQACEEIEFLELRLWKSSYKIKFADIEFLLNIAHRQLEVRYSMRVGEIFG